MVRQPVSIQGAMEIPKVKAAVGLIMEQASELAMLGTSRKLSQRRKQFDTRKMTEHLFSVHLFRIFAT